MWIFDLNYANEVSRSATMWMTNLQDLIKTVSTFCASIALSMIKNVQGHMNLLSPIYESVSVFESVDHLEPAWTNELWKACLDVICEWYVLL